MSFKNANLPSLFNARAALEAEISAAREALEATLAPKKAKLEELNTDIATIAVPLARAAYEKEGKPDGTLRFASGDKIFKSEIKKTVSYDGDALMAIAGSIPWEEARTIFKFKADVPEKAFKALPEGPLKASIMAARSTKYSEPKITLDD